MMKRVSADALFSPIDHKMLSIPGAGARLKVSLAFDELRAVLTNGIAC